MGSIPITRFHSGWTAGLRGKGTRVFIVCCGLDDRDREFSSVAANARGLAGSDEMRWDEMGHDGQAAAVAQSVERVLGKDEVLGSSPSGSSGVCGPDW